jgi:DNA-binding NarL/FixJ family response regulator
LAASASAPPVQILIAEPDEPTRVGLRLALEDHGFTVCAEPVDAGSVMSAAASEQPAVCLIDEALPGGSLVAVNWILTRLPTVKVILLTDAEEPATLLSSIRAGASGYLRTDLGSSRLPATVRGVLDGEAAMSRRLTYRLMEALRTRSRGRMTPTRPGGPSISDRELDVLEHLTEGLGTGEIALRMSISQVTVRRHISSAMAKLGVKDRAAALKLLSGRADP